MINRTVRGLVVAALVALVALTAVSPALGAPAPWKSVDVTVHYEENQPIVLVSGYLPESTKLPAAVELAVPRGGQFLWAGEILGGSPSADPAVEYTVKQSGDMDVYSFTLTKARIGQIELQLPTAMSFDGTAYRSALSWTATSDVPEANLYVRMPAGSQVTEAAQGAGVTEGPTGYSYYTRSAKDVKAGTKLDLAFAFTAPAGATAGTATTSAPAPASNSTLPTVLIIAAVLGAFALIFVGIKNKMAVADHDEPVQAEQPTRTAPTKRPAATAPVAAEETEPAATKGASKAPLLMGIVVGVLVIGGLIAAGSGTSTQQFNGQFVRDFGNPTACTTTAMKLNVPQGENPEQVAEKFFEAVKGVPSVGKVTVNIEAATAEVAYCDSSASKEQVLAAAGTTGMVAGELGTSSQDASAAPVPAGATTVTPAP